MSVEDDIQRAREELLADIRAVRDRLAALRTQPPWYRPRLRRLHHRAVEETTAAVARVEERAEALRTRVENWRAEPGVIPWIARRGWRFGVATAMAAPLATLLTNTLIVPDATVRMAFFAAAAQVIPVLVLAAAVEGRVFEVSQYVRRPALQAYYVVYFGWIAAGEIAALYALGEGEGTGLLYALTFAGLANAGTALAVMALAGRNE